MDRTSVSGWRYAFDIGPSTGVVHIVVDQTSRALCGGVISDIHQIAFARDELALEPAHLGRRCAECLAAAVAANNGGGVGPVISVRLTVNAWRALLVEATRRDERPSAVLRRWIDERLEQEGNDGERA